MENTNMKIATITNVLLAQPPTAHRDHNVYRMVHDAERYVIDFAADFATDGWQQFDTDQDAHYFGVWLNPRKLWSLTYAEGDWSLTVCQDAEHYNAAVRAVIKFYGEGFVAKVIDAEGQMAIYQQDRSKFLLPVTA